MPRALTGDWPVASASGGPPGSPASLAVCRLSCPLRRLPLAQLAAPSLSRYPPRRLLSAPPIAPALAIVFIVKYTLI